MTYLFPGSSLFELQLKDYKLEVVNVIHMPPVSYDQIETVVCNDTVYTLYKHISDDRCSSVSLEKFSLTTFTNSFILDHVSEESTIQIADMSCIINKSTKLFNYFNINLLKENIYVTNFVF